MFETQTQLKLQYRSETKRILNCEIAQRTQSTKKKEFLTYKYIYIYTYDCETVFVLVLR